MAQTVDEIHAKSEIKEVDVTKMRIDTSYQRDFSEVLVDDIANNWDAVAAELVTISWRGMRKDDPNGVEGGFFVVNGQHRSKAAQKKGLLKIWARVIDLSKEVDPAAIEAGFRLRTNKRLGDRPLERFKAQLRANDDESIAISKLVVSVGSEINMAPNPDQGINCISTIETIYRLDDGVTLRHTLQIVKDVYGYAGGKFAKSDLLKAISWFIEKHADESDRDRLVSKMKAIGANVLEQRARTTNLTMGGSLWLNYYRTLVDLYNEQLRERNRLEWKTRGKSALGTTGKRGA